MERHTLIRKLTEELTRQTHAIGVVAILGLLVLLLLGGQCDRKVGVDASPGPVSLADLVAWWRLDRDGVPPDLDHESLDRLAAIFDEGRASWDAWMETRWRPFIESLPADEEDRGDRRKAIRRRLSAADGLRAEMIALDDRTVLRIEQEGGLPPETAARFGRWYRLERARRLAAGFATGGGSPASPEAIVASAPLDGLQRRAVVMALDDTVAERTAGIMRFAAERRRTGECRDAGPSIFGKPARDPADEEVLAQFEAARWETSRGAALALVDAARVVGDEAVALRWRSMAARLLLGDVESPGLHRGLVAATRMLANLDVGDVAAIDRASHAYVDGIQANEKALEQVLDTGSMEEIEAAATMATARAAELRAVRNQALKLATNAEGGLAAAMLDLVDEGPRRAAEWRSLWFDRLTDEDAATVIAALGPSWVVPEDFGDAEAAWGLSLDGLPLPLKQRVGLEFLLARVFEGPPSGRKPVPMSDAARTHPVVASLLSTHSSSVRVLLQRDLAELVKLVGPMIMKGESEPDAAVETITRVADGVDRLVRDLAELDGDLAMNLAACGVDGINAAELDNWLARRARDRWWLDPEMRRLIAPGGEMEIGVWGRFDVAIQSATLPAESRDVALGIERELADRIGQARQRAQRGTLADLATSMQQAEDEGSRGPVWTTIKAQAAEERAIDAEIRRLIRERLPDLDAAILIDAWSAERVPAAAAWFAIGEDGFTARRRLTASAIGGEAVAIAFDEWMSARGALRDDMLTWWSEAPSPPTTGDDGHRRDALRGESRVQIALARRRALDGRLAADLVRILGPNALDDPFVRRLVASPIPVSQRLGGKPDESRDPTAAISPFEISDDVSEAINLGGPGVR